LPATLDEHDDDALCEDGLMVVLSWSCSSWRGLVVGLSGLFGGDFGDGDAGGGLVDDLAVAGVGGDE
jgi:hypothetical protein